ncbi:MAG: mechanosensitive ion channel family protein [Candidatus Puniceispirillaceae bacterium]
MMDATATFFSSIDSVTVLLEQAVPAMVNILAGIGTLIIGFWLSGRAAKFIRVQTGKISRVDPTLSPILASIARYAGLILTFVVALGQFGIQTTSIIAVLGAAGLAIGLALQGTLSNVAAGIMLLLLRPFGVGDWIEANGISGTVREIGLFATQIDTFENVYISVPNSSIWSSIIINHSRHDVRRMDIDIGIGYESDLDVAEQALMSLCEDERIQKTPAPVFLVVAYGDSAITVRLRLYANYCDYFQLNWDLNRRLKGTLDTHNIEIPFPQLVLSRKTDEMS